MKALKWIVGIVMSLVGFLFVSPIILMAMTSFKHEGDVLNPSTVVPKVWTVENYTNVLSWAEEAPFGKWLLNSIFVSCSVTLLVLLISSMAAYAITRLKVPGGSQFLTVVIFSMMVPGQLFLVPVYFILSKLHWLDTPFALIIPAASLLMASRTGMALVPSAAAMPASVRRSPGCSWPDMISSRRSWYTLADRV